MDLLGLLLLTTLSSLPPVQETVDFPGSVGWRETWRDFDTLTRSAPGSADRRRMVAELGAFQARHERSARKRHDRPEVFRSRVLGAHLARIAGAPYQPVADPGVQMAWLPGEGWIAAQVSGPGPTRVAAIEAALAETRPKEIGARLRFAFALAEGEARDLHWDEARAMALAVHRRVQAVPIDDLPSDHRSGAKATLFLAYVTRMLGEPTEALAILERHLESAPEADDRRQLFLEMSCARFVAGQDDSARRDLGEALALGSPDAGCLLGRLALSEAAGPRARACFRSLLSGFENGAAPTPALRGYGLALLTNAGPSVPSTRNLPDPPR